ncbi:MAG TPA: hypothetical protein VFM14_10790 [Gemmatimonadales bacterium]|nr:hypothetical protein [Gemmatimonadales bacterium]
MTLRPGRPLWLLLGALIALTLAADCARVARADMAFLLYAAGAWLDGAKLYRDVVEINPPLVIWLNAPIVALARALGVSELRLYSFAVAGTMTALLVYGGRVARRFALRAHPELQAWLLLGTAIALFPLARADFGQREHIVLGLMLPYVLLVVARLKSVEVPRWDAGCIGVLAGTGFSLKPHFVLVWLGLEALKYWRAPAARRAPGPEAIAVGATIALYVAAVRLLTPAYVDVVGVLGPAYAQYLHAPFLELLLLAPGAGLTLFAGLALVALRRRMPDPVLGWALGVAMLGCFVAAAAQQKGLHYHFYPASALALMVLATLAPPLVIPAALPLTERIYAAVARAVLAAVGLVAVGGTLLTVLGGGAAERRARAELFELVGIARSEAGGRPVVVLSYHMDSAFPLVNYAGVRLASRFPHLWILPAMYWDSLAAGGAVRYRDLGDMPAAERWLNQGVREDLLAADPRLMIVLRPARDAGMNGPRRMHYVRYFSRQPELATLFGRFHLLRRVGEFDVYVRGDAGAPAARSLPSAAPGELDVKGADGGIQLAFDDPEFLAGTGIFVVVLGLTVLRAQRAARAAGGSEATRSYRRFGG